MITAMIKKWKPINGLEHIATTWVVGTALDKNNMVIDIIDRVDNSNQLTMYYSNVEVPIGETYYVQAKRHFNRAAIDYWGKPLAVTSEEVDYDNLVLNGDVYIEAPYIYVTKEDFDMNNSKVTMRTSKFRTNLDIHVATHWFIRDGKGNILYSNINDKINKTSISIDNDANFTNKAKLEIIAIHVGMTGVESKPGKKYINVAGGGNFEIVTNIASVNPLEDLVIKFKSLDGSNDLLISNINLSHAVNHSIIIPNLTLTSDNTVTIPWYLLHEGAKYNLDIDCYSRAAGNVTVTKQIVVHRYSDDLIKNPNYSYTDTLDKDICASTDLIRPNHPFHTEAMFNGYILMPTDNNYVEIWKYDNDVLINTKRVANGLALPNTIIDHTYIRPVSKGLVLIDTFNEQGKPTFYLYKYNLNNDMFNLAHSKTRDDETVCLGKMCNILQISTELFIYNVYGTNKLRTYNIVTNEVSELNTIPIDNITKAILLRARNNKIFIGNGTDYTSVVYDTEKDRFIEGYKFGPDSFVDRDIRLVPMINGSTLLINLEFQAPPPGSIGKYESNMEVYVYKNGNFRTFQDRKDLVIENVSCSIVTNTGPIIFLYNNHDGSVNITTYK